MLAVWSSSPARPGQPAYEIDDAFSPVISKLSRLESNVELGPAVVQY